MLDVVELRIDTLTTAGFISGWSTSKRYRWRTKVSDVILLLKPIKRVSE